MSIATRTGPDSQSSSHSLRREVVVVDPFPLDRYVRFVPLPVLMFPAPLPHTSDRAANDMRTVPSLTCDTLRAMVCAGSAADTTIAPRPHTAAAICFVVIC
jgi:hypothetical protein